LTYPFLVVYSLLGGDEVVNYTRERKSDASETEENNKAAYYGGRVTAGLGAANRVWRRGWGFQRSGKSPPASTLADGMCDDTAFLLVRGEGGQKTDIGFLTSFYLLLLLASLDIFSALAL
jgi:hypothetical protein